MEETPFEIREIGADVGEGLFAKRTFDMGDFIAEYTGRKIPTKVADAMTDARYLFEIDADWTIDGEDPSNIARFINHSCAPNAESEIHDGHVLICALRRIKIGEEITMDYGEEYYDEFIRPSGCKCAAAKHR